MTYLNSPSIEISNALATFRNVSLCIYLNHSPPIAIFQSCGEGRNQLRRVDGNHEAAKTYLWKTIYST